MRKLLFLAANLIILYLLFRLGGHTPRPGSSSGNGNPAILVVIPLVLLFVVLVWQWIDLFKNKRMAPMTIAILLVLIAGHWTAGTIYQVHRYYDYRQLLADVYAEKFGFTDWEYINDITSGISIHIINQYVNTNTYSMFVSLSLLIWQVYRLIRREQ